MVSWFKDMKQQVKQKILFLNKKNKQTYNLPHKINVANPDIFVDQTSAAVSTVYSNSEVVQIFMLNFIDSNFAELLKILF
jgi:hypothetical protein